MGASSMCGSDAIPVLRRPCSLIALRPSNPRLGALRTGGMSSSGRAAAHQSLHGFADGSSGCQGAGSFPALSVCLWLHPPCCSAKRSRVLLTQDLPNQIADLLRLPHSKSSFQFRVSVSAFGTRAGDNDSDKAEPRPGDRSWLHRGFLPKPQRNGRPRTVGVPSRRLGETDREDACLIL